MKINSVLTQMNQKDHWIYGPIQLRVQHANGLFVHRLIFFFILFKVHHQVDSIIPDDIDGKDPKNREWNDNGDLHRDDRTEGENQDLVGDQRERHEIVPASDQAMQVENNDNIMGNVVDTRGESGAIIQLVHKDNSDQNHKTLYM